jgi:protein SCO1
MNERSKSRFLLVLSVGLAAAAAGCGEAPAPPAPLEGARLGGAFTLTDHRGRRVTEKDFEGRYRIAYFGFSACPDICPTDLATIGQALRRFETQHPERAARVVPTFITVDPERDTPEAIAGYVAAFHPRILGLTGSPQQIAHVARAHGVYYTKMPAEGGRGYTVDHSRLVLLFGPKGEPIAMLPWDKGADAVAAELERWVR